MTLNKIKLYNVTGRNSNSGGGGNGIISTTFEALRAFTDTNTLIPGQRYKFPFQTIYLQYATSIIKTGTTENIIITANSVNTFEEEIESLEYPNDLIRYNFFDQLAEDGVTPTKGFITYRKDTIKNISCYYDFRAVKYFRYTINPALFSEWTTGTTYYPGNIRTHDGQIYRCRVQHDSDIFADDYTFFKWESIYINNQKIWWHTTNFLGGIVKANTIGTEYYTFGESVTNASIGKSQEFRFNNIVILKGTDIEIGNDCYNGTVDHLSVGYDPAMNIVIKDFVSNFILDTCKNNTIDSFSTGFFVGVGCNSNELKKETSNVYIAFESKHNTIHSLNVNTYIADWSHHNVIGKNSKYIHLGASSSNNFIGQENSNMVFQFAWRNNIGRHNSDCRFKYALDNATEENCSTIQNSIDVIDYGTMSYNKFGNSCANIDISGVLTYTNFKGRNTNILVLLSVNTCEFSVGVSNKILNANWYGVYYNIFHNSTKEYTSYLEKRTIFMVDTDGEVWYSDILPGTGAMVTTKVS